MDLVESKLRDLELETAREQDAIRDVARMTNFLSAVGVEAGKFSDVPQSADGLRQHYFLDPSVYDANFKTVRPITE